MLKRIGAEEGGEFKAIASGTLPSGKPVVVNSDGTVSVVSETTVSESVGTPVNITGSQLTRPAVAYDANAQKVVIAYRDNGNSNQGYAVVGTVSGTSISFGTPVQFESGYTDQVDITYDSTAQKVVIAYQDIDNSSYGTAVVGTVSGTSISFGTPVVFKSAALQSPTRIAYHSAKNRVGIIYKNSSATDNGEIVIGEVSGTSLTFGSSVTFESGLFNDGDIVYDASAERFVTAHKDENTSNNGFCCVISVGGTGDLVPTVNTRQSFNGSSSASKISAVYDSSNQKVVIAFADGASSAAGTAIVATIGSTSATFGTKVQFTSNNISDATTGIAYDSGAGKVVISYRDRANSNGGYIVSGAVSGTSISFDTPVVFDTNTVAQIHNAYDANAEKVVTVFYDSTSVVGQAFVFQTGYTSTPLTSENYIGMSRGVAATDTRSEAIGSPTVFETGEPSNITTAYDSSNNRVVISYRDGGNNFYATTVVGTVSGTSISFGTPVVFNSENSGYITNVFDSNAGKVVTFYTTSLGYPSAKVGTVSGTSISYGSATTIISSSHSINGATFDSTNNKVIIGHGSAGGGNTNVRVGTVSGTSITFGSATTTETTYLGAMGFDSTNGKVVLALYTVSNGGRAYVGTVSGTSISFGSAVQFNSNIGDLAGVAHDPNSGKTVIGYRKGGGQAAAIVGTVSGTSISFGSETEVQTSNTTNVGMGFDSRVNKIIYAYRYGPSPYNGRLRVGTVSGTSISFDSEVTFESGETNSLSPTSIAFDSTENVVIIGYKDAGDSNKAKAVVYQAAGSFVNRAEVADGGNASMDIIGSVSTNQLSLTAGQQYYVQTDGTISTTAGSPSVLAGTAISATELVVKT